MLTIKFGINFELNRDKSVDALVKEHEKELQKLKWEKENKEAEAKP